MILAVDYEELKSKYSILQNDWRRQQEIIGRLETKTTKLQSQLKNQAAFSTKIGAILGHYLWKITEDPDIVNIILQQVINLNKYN